LKTLHEIDEKLIVLVHKNCPLEIHNHAQALYKL